MSNLRNGIKHPQQISMLIDENELLKARVVRLEDAINKAIWSIGEADCHAIIGKALNEAPAQSLALHDADVIEDTVLHKCVFPKGSITVAGIHALTEYADSLRKSIKEGEK